MPHKKITDCLLQPNGQNPNNPRKVDHLCWSIWMHVEIHSVEPTERSKYHFPYDKRPRSKKNDNIMRYSVDYWGICRGSARHWMTPMNSAPYEFSTLCILTYIYIFIYIYVRTIYILYIYIYTPCSPRIWESLGSNNDARRHGHKP